jgi:predicted NBD/HSP70 family sugar kinase/N-acetylmuramic acid 6-phosphate (MurNAc-6-P) etherase/GNAT superfamily N-acetyltransferase
MECLHTELCHVRMAANPAMSVPVTELVHPLCETLDGAVSPSAFLRTLRAADSEIFAGYGGYAGLAAPAVRADLGRAARAVADALDADDASGVVVLTGCGTSGRLAFLTARRYRAATGGRVRYACAGGDSALLLSDEQPEDDPHQGRRDVAHAAAGATTVYLVGVSCGLSAPYVAGQIAAALPTAAPSVSGVTVVGFNPVDLARNVPIPHCHPDGTPASFQACLQALLARGRTLTDVVLNPVVGPEPVAGSSRMKGGSATLVLLDVLLLAATKTAAETPAAVDAALAAYQQVHALTYAAAAGPGSFAMVMEAAASAVRSGGRLLYVGAGSAGCVGFIDASEMPDTYGAPFDQTRAFVAGGWAAIGNAEGDMASRSPLHRVGLDHFASDLLPTLATGRDVVVVLHGPDCTHDEARALADVAARAAAAGVAVHSLQILAVPATNAAALASPSPSPHGSTVQVTLPAPLLAAAPGAADLALKLLVNAVSTYAQAAGRGAVYRGRMIATGPANDKIYDRCLRLVAEHGVVPVSLAAAERALVRSIYGVDAPAAVEACLQRPRADHIRAATLPADQRHQAQIVLPVAFLLADPRTPTRTVAQAQAAVAAEPRLSALLALPPPTPNSTRAVHHVLGIDVGGTNVRAAVVRARDGSLVTPVVRQPLGTIAGAAAVPTNPAAFLAIVTAVAHDAVRACDPVVRIDAVAVGQPGHVHPDGSIAQLAAFPHWGDTAVPLAAELTHAVLTVAAPSPVPPVLVLSDAACALAAEVQYGAGRLARIVAMVTVGTGVGTAATVDGGATLLSGTRGLIELGHALAYPDGVPCACGQRGCVEAYASGPAIARAATLAAGRPTTAEDAVAHAAEGDPAMQAVLDAAATALAIGCLTVVRAYDPDVVVLAGGLAAALVTRLRYQLRQRTWHLHNDALEVPLALATCPEPGVQGAAALASTAAAAKATAPSCPWLRRPSTAADHIALDALVGEFVPRSADATACYERVLVDHDHHEDRAGEVGGAVRAVVHAALPSTTWAASFPSTLAVAVQPQWRGRGYDEIMVRRALDALRGAGSPGVRIVVPTAAETDAARASLLARLGFHARADDDRAWVLAL